MAVPPEIVPDVDGACCSSRRPSRIEAIARAAARIALRPSSGRMPACAAAPRNAASTRKCVGESSTISPIGEAWSKTKPKSLRRREASNARAPASATSSPTVNSSSTSTGAPAWRTWRASASSTAIAALLSAPRMPSLAFSQPPSRAPAPQAPAAERCRGARTAAASVRRPLLPRRARAAALAGMRASRLPQSEPTRGPASSSSTCTPSARSSAITRSAQPRSRPEGLSIRQSSANVPLR